MFPISSLERRSYFSGAWWPRLTLALHERWGSYVCWRRSSLHDCQLQVAHCIPGRRRFPKRLRILRKAFLAADLIDFLLLFSLFFFFSFGAGGEGGRRKGTYLSGHRSGRNDSENDLKVAAMAFGPCIAHIDDLVNRCLWKQFPVVKDVTHNYVNVLDENGTLTLMAPMSQYCTFIYQASCRCHIYVPKSEEYFVRIDNEIGNERSTTTLKSL